MNRPLSAVLALAALTATVSAQPPTTRPPEPVTLTLHPADEPIPALRYRLAPERRDLVPGNAVIFYHRAIQLVAEANRRQQPQPARPEPGSGPAELLAEWASGPIDSIHVERARSLLGFYESALHEVELGARRLDCDWEFDQRTEGITLLIGEIQESRSLARLVALRARLAILDRDVDAAMHWIQVGFTLGRHVADGPSVIQALVGIAIDSVMATCLQDLIQAPGTPSLYWALATRTRPAIDMRRPLEGERYLLEKELPELNDLDRRVWSKDEARRFADELQRKLFTMVDGGQYGIAGASDMSSFGRRLGIAAMAAKLYPEAKRRLIEGGRPADVIERMPVIQVATLDTLLEYNRVRDDIYKWLSLPYWQSVDGLQNAEERGLVEPKATMTNPLLVLFSMLTPALNSARLAQVRLDRQLDALQTIEAIRRHVAREGSLPQSLDALDVPIPLDPATGKPFAYRLDGDSATLTAPLPPGAPDHPSYQLNYVLKLAK
jgi:hypothetical protein